MNKYRLQWNGHSNALTPHPEGELCTYAEVAPLEKKAQAYDALEVEYQRLLRRSRELENLFSLVRAAWQAKKAITQAHIKDLEETVHQLHMKCLGLTTSLQHWKPRAEYLARQVEELQRQVDKSNQDLLELD